MKFAALLRSSLDELPQMRELFAGYKELKKQLKASEERPGEAGTRASEEFFGTLRARLQLFNHRFCENEVTFTRQLGHYEAEAADASRPRPPLYQALANFHGDLVLTLHWSIMAYYGLIKILKKYKKRTGETVNPAALSDLLQQPFARTESLNALIARTEHLLRELAPQLGGDEAMADAHASAARAECSEEVTDIGAQAAREDGMDVVGEQDSSRATTSRPTTHAPPLPAGLEQASMPLHSQRTCRALQMLQELRDNASTPSTVMCDRPPPPPAGMARGGGANPAGAVFVRVSSDIDSSCSVASHMT